MISEFAIAIFGLYTYIHSIDVYGAFNKLASSTSDRRDRMRVSVANMQLVLTVVGSIISCITAVSLPNGQPSQQADGHAPGRVVISEAPSMVLLDQQPINLLAEISARKDDLIKFGTRILDDLSGNKVSAIEEDHKSMYSMAREICRQWLAGKGKYPVSWNTLIHVLEQIQLKTLAARIKDSAHHTYYDIVQNTAKFLSEIYSNQPVIRFDPLNIAGYTPFLEITMNRSDGSKMFVPHWKNIFNHTSVRELQRLLITGRPGTGKTTLLRYLARKWAEGRALHFCKILFLIHLGQLKSRGQPAWNSLRDMLTSAYSDLKDIQNVASEITGNHGVGACFLLDAYDEWHHDDYVHDLIFQNRLNNSFCVLTSRYRKEHSGLNHAEMIGFECNDLNRYVATIANNHSLTQSVLDLWSKYPDVRHMCTLPLHLAMIVFIMRYESTPKIHTRAQIYMAFVNATIKHYRYSHPYWNTVSLRHCIHNSNADDIVNDLCTAFQTLHFVAFKMLFNQVYTFPDHPDIQQNIAKLGFVEIKVVPSTSDLVQYTFSHPTFLEFFAILHLTTLSRNEQLVYINLYGRENNNNMVSLYVELINDLHPSKILEVAGPGTHSVINDWADSKPFHPMCRFKYINVTSLKYMELVTQVCSSEKADDFLKLVGAHSIICAQDIWDHRLLGDVLSPTAVHRVRIKGGNDCMNYSIVFEDLDYNFDSIHLCLTSGEWDDCVQLSELSVKILSVEGLQASQICIRLLFNIVRNYLPSSFLFQVSASIENLFMLSNETNSLYGIHVEVTISLDNIDCVWTKKSKNIVKLLELLPTIKGVHIISDCKFVMKDKIYEINGIFDKWLTIAASLLHLPQYETLKITGNIPFLMKLLYGQTDLRHLYLHKVNMKIDWNKVIENNRYLQTLEIVDSHFRDKELQELLRYLPDTLRALNLDGNALTDNIMGELSLRLKHFHEFNYLSLKHNNITGNGVKSFVSAIAFNKHFHYLDLSSNPIDVQYFVQCHVEFSQLESLEYLAFDGCKVLNNEHLHTFLQNFPKLRCLHLCKNHLPKDLIYENMTELDMYPNYKSCCSDTVSSSTRLMTAPCGHAAMLLADIITYTLALIVSFMFG